MNGMSNDLISRKVLLGTERLLMTNIVENNPTAKYILEQVLFDIENAPTAFDKEKVIDEIKNQLELSDTCAYESDYPTEVSYYKGRALGHEIDIEIVKKGGIDTVN